MKTALRARHVSERRQLPTYIRCQISQSLFDYEASYAQHADISRQGGDERIPAVDQGKVVQLCSSNC